MSFVRLMCAAIVGGLVVFAWGFVSHEFLGVAWMAFGTMENEEAVVQAVGTAVQDGERQAFLFPGIMKKGATPEELEAAYAVWEKGPRGMLVVDATPMTNSFPKLMATEFGVGVVAALIASIVAAGVRGGYAGRVATVALLGVFAWMAVDASYWNWYRFPDGFAMAGLIDQGVGWLLAAFPIAAIARPRRTCGCGPGCGCGPECGCGPGCECGKKA